MKEFPPFRLDTVNQCLWRAGGAGEDERVSLTPKAFAVLLYLVDRAGRLVTQEELLEAVWPDTFIQPEVLKYQIADIRGVLGDQAKNPVFIETLPRRGYRFVAAVRDGARADSRTLTSTARGRLVGRARELAELRARFEMALRGERQIVFVTGEPGIGKTALVDEFQRQAASEHPSLLIARAQCLEGYGGTEAYYPMLEALGQLCRGPGGERVVETLAAHAPTWLVQFPSLIKREQRQALQQEILGATRDRMLREIREALDALNLGATALWVFEDVQWVDLCTADLISATARGRRTAKAMVILTNRPMDLAAPNHPLRTLKPELVTHRLCREIALGPLSEAAVAEYLRAESGGGALPEGFAELVHRNTEGNPLFMIAALDHMMERGLIAREGEQWRLKAPVGEIEIEAPETLRQIFEAQIEHLTSEEQRILEAASVAGVRFPAQTVAKAMRQDAEAMEELFEKLARRSRMIRATGPGESTDGRSSQVFEFVHALYREVFYRRQTPTRRAALQRRIGQELA
jgi:predicted ATPase/DNA-binding winged helix-turn-helix (wHTH) protein